MEASAVVDEVVQGGFLGRQSQRDINLVRAEEGGTSRESQEPKP